MVLASVWKWREDAATASASTSTTTTIATTCLPFFLPFFLPFLPAEIYNFSSERKMASMLAQHPSGALRLYNKGAAEMVLLRCTSMIDASGQSVPMTEVRGEVWMVGLVCVRACGCVRVCGNGSNLCQQGCGGGHGGWWGGGQLRVCLHAQPPLSTCLPSLAPHLPACAAHRSALPACPALPDLLIAAACRLA